MLCEAGQDIDACTIRTPSGDEAEGRRRAVWLLRAAALPNEADLRQTTNGWEASGDTVDVALLGRYYERIADHAVSVANRVVFVVTGTNPRRSVRRIV